MTKVQDAKPCPRGCGIGFSGSTDAAVAAFIVRHLEVVHGEQLPSRPRRPWTYVDLLKYAKGQTAIKKKRAEMQAAQTVSPARRRKR